MAAKIEPWKQEVFRCETVCCAEEELKDATLSPAASSHLALCVRSTSAVSGNIPLCVVDGSSGIKVPFVLESPDTIGKLQTMYLQCRPDLVGKLNLVFNGKPVTRDQTLAELGVKPGAMLITYQKCTGG